ncbi:MAG: hypothetical protein R3A78_01730 [Polyangiales bacterium]
MLLMLVIAISPNLWLTAERNKRTTQMEDQLAQWLMLLANALRATPSVGAAVEASVKLLPFPFATTSNLSSRKCASASPSSEHSSEWGSASTAKRFRARWRPS